MHLFGLVISPSPKRLVASLDNIPPEPRFTPSCQRAVFVWKSKLFYTSIIPIVKRAIFQTLSNSIIKKVRNLTFFLISHQNNYQFNTVLLLTFICCHIHCLNIKHIFLAIHTRTSDSLYLSNKKSFVTYILHSPPE